MATETKKTESKTKQTQETQVKKISRYTQYLKTEYRKGTISNMKAVLK